MIFKKNPIRKTGLFDKVHFRKENEELL